MVRVLKPEGEKKELPGNGGPVGQDGGEETLCTKTWIQRLTRGTESQVACTLVKVEAGVAFGKRVYGGQDPYEKGTLWVSAENKRKKKKMEESSDFLFIGKKKNSNQFWGLFRGAFDPWLLRGKKR